MHRNGATGEDCCETRAEADFPWARIPPRMRRRLPPAVPATWGLGFLLGVAATGLAAAAAWVAARRSVGEMTRLAEASAAQGDLEGALRWLRRARRRAPDDVELALDEGWHLAKLGRTDEAIALYARLPLPPGQAAWLTALTLFEGGGDLARVEGLVVEALDAAPLLVEELALEPGLSRALEGRLQVEEARERARRRLG